MHAVLLWPSLKIAVEYRAFKIMQTFKTYFKIKVNYWYTYCQLLHDKEKSSLTPALPDSVVTFTAVTEAQSVKL